MQIFKTFWLWHRFQFISYQGFTFMITWLEVVIVHMRESIVRLLVWQGVNTN